MSKAYKDLLLKEVKELLVKLPPNVRIRVYYDDMGKSKYTLNELGSRMDKFDTKLNQIGDALFEFIKVTNENFKKVNTRIDNLTNDVNERFDRIDVRLDYIVKANNLKDLPKNK